MGVRGVVAVGVVVVVGGVAVVVGMGVAVVGIGVPVGVVSVAPEQGRSGFTNLSRTLLLNSLRWQLGTQPVAVDTVFSLEATISS